MPCKETASTHWLRDNAVAIAGYLSEVFCDNNVEAIKAALSRTMRAQNVQALAAEAGMRRDGLYSTFDGRTDPQLSRILKLFSALNVRARVDPSTLGSAEVRSDISLLRTRSKTSAERLTQAFDDNKFENAITGLRDVALAENVSALARSSGLPRKTIYRSFGGEVDPHLSSLLRLFTGLGVRIVVVALPDRPIPPRPRLGRPPKLSVTPRN